MANSISGRVIAVSPIQTVASSDPSKAPLKKRMVYIDCTRYDPYTGERSQFENKPLMEFSGDKILEKVGAKLDQLKKDDIVTVYFDIQGVDYTDKATGKKKNFTGIRSYDIEVRRQAGQPIDAAPAPQQSAPAPQTAQPAPMAQSPFAGEDSDKDPLPF